VYNQQSKIPGNTPAGDNKHDLLAAGRVIIDKDHVTWSALSVRSWRVTRIFMQATLLAASDANDAHEVHDDNEDESRSLYSTRSDVAQRSCNVPCHTSVEL